MAGVIMFAKKTVDLDDLREKLLDYVVDKMCLQYNEQMIRTAFGLLAGTAAGERVMTSPDGAAKFGMAVLYLLKNAPNFGVTSGAGLAKLVEENPRLVEKFKDGALYAGEFHDGIVAIMNKNAPPKEPSQEMMRQWMSQIPQAEIEMYKNKAKDIAERNAEDEKNSKILEGFDTSEIEGPPPAKPGADR